MKLSQNLSAKIEEDVKRFVRSNYSEWVNGKAGNETGELELVEKQLACERERARSNSPFYSLQRHLFLLSKLKAK